MLEVVGNDGPRDMIVTRMVFMPGGDRTRLTARQQSVTPALRAGVFLFLRIGPQAVNRGR